MKELKGIIFDFNGILLWDRHMHEEVWQDLASEIAGREVSLEEIQKLIHGLTNTAIAEHFAGRKLDRKQLDAYIQTKESAYQQKCLTRHEEFKLSPGAEEFLDYLKDAGKPMTIGTSSGIENLDFYFKHLHLDRWFKFDLVSYDDLTIKGKPAPDIYLIAARKLGLRPSECIVLEDAVSGVAAAHAAGTGKIIAMGPPETHAELAQLPGVNQTITDFHDLLKNKDAIWR